MGTDEKKLKQLKQLLDDQHDWPTEFMFKFIVPQDKEQEVKSIFPYQNVSLNFSRNGRYVSITVTLIMESAEAILEVYNAASKIEGIIAL